MINARDRITIVISIIPEKGFPKGTETFPVEDGDKHSLDRLPPSSPSSKHHPIMVDRSISISHDTFGCPSSPERTWLSTPLDTDVLRRKLLYLVISIRNISGKENRKINNK